MKLIIQIPCYNEEATLRVTLDALPREIPGIDCIEVLVIDDGSEDDTAGEAQRCGVQHVVRLSGNKGLARAFCTGIERCLREGADIVVNTDADNQYCADDIRLLVAPILEGRADMVVGSRPITDIEHFSPIKKLFQRVGTWVVRYVSMTDINDAPSGFRAFSRAAASQLRVYNRYTYTLETIIQAGRKGMTVVSVPIRVNGYLRPSRLMNNMWDYIAKSVLTILRIFMLYSPLRFFFMLSGIFASGGAAIWIRFLWYFFHGDGGGKVQSLILGSLMLGTSFLLVVAGLIADVIALNRTIMERMEWRVFQLEEDIRNRRL